MDCMRLLESLEPQIVRIAQQIVHILERGGKILVCGNGGSAADSQHFAAEMIGRFERERSPYPAIALTTDTSILTAVANDYGSADIFARQLAGLGRPGDILIAISTSGESENILNAVRLARKNNIRTVGLLGKKGGRICDAVDHPLVVRHNTTARIQEAHIFILHFWAGYIEGHPNTGDMEKNNAFH